MVDLLAPVDELDAPSFFDELDESSFLDELFDSADDESPDAAPSDDDDLDEDELLLDLRA